MSAVATAIVGGAVVGGLITANASQNAASTEAGAANNATSAQEGMFNTTQGINQPYVQAGSNAEQQIMANMGAWNSNYTPEMYYNSPGYQWQLQQGEGALKAQEAAQGARYGTGSLAAADSYAQGLASTGYNQAFQQYQQQIQGSYNRLAGIAQLGQASAANTGAAAISTGQSIGQNLTAAGTAQAAGQIGTANAITGAIGNTTNGLMNYNLMSNLMGNGQNTAAISAAFNSPNAPQLTMPQLGAGAPGSSPIGSLY